jgi:hypothetical protein
VIKFSLFQREILGYPLANNESTDDQIRETNMSYLKIVTNTLQETGQRLPIYSDTLKGFFKGLPITFHTISQIYQGASNELKTFTRGLPS